MGATVKITTSRTKLNSKNYKRTAFSKVSDKYVPREAICAILYEILDKRRCSKSGR